MSRICHRAFFWIAAAIWMATPALGARPGGEAKPDGPALVAYESKYYTIYTDLNETDAREASIRMTCVAEEYERRTRDFAGTINRKLPFYLYKHEEDYWAAGAPHDSRGLFTGTALLAVAGEHPDARTWHVVQHEAFHQFNHTVLRGPMPPWLDEGMAEYFGEGVFTGEGLVTGVIPQWRLDRVRREMKAGSFVSIRKMMSITPREWSRDIDIVNYDEAWTIVQFLAHADNGKHQAAFSRFLKAQSTGEDPERAWQEQLGDPDEFEQAWKSYWTNLPDNPTADLFTQATVEQLTAFLGRAAARKQEFETFEAFRDAAAAGKLECEAKQWLPPALLSEALGAAKGRGKWTLEKPSKDKPEQIVATLDNGTKIVGTFTLSGRNVSKVSSQIKKAKE